MHVLTRVHNPNIVNTQRQQHLRTTEPDCASKHVALLMTFMLFIIALACGLWRSFWVFPHLKLITDVDVSHLVFVLCVRTFALAHRVKIANYQHIPKRDALDNFGIFFSSFSAWILIKFIWFTRTFRLVCCLMYNRMHCFADTLLAGACPQTECLSSLGHVKLKGLKCHRMRPYMTFNESLMKYTK